MTTTPSATPVPRTSRVIHLSELLKRPVTDRGGESLGRVSDVIVRLRGAQLPAVEGLVVTVASIFVSDYTPSFVKCLTSTVILLLVKSSADQMFENR